MDFLKDVVKEIGGDYTQLASEIDETESYVDTGSYVFNALVSGSIFGGVSGNKITAIAGESSTGKTFFSLAVVKNFLDSNPDGYCLYFDTEAAITKSLLESRGVDTSRTVVVNVVTIEEFRTRALKAVDIYLKSPVEDRKPCMFVLDSLGMLSTDKEIKDALDDKQVRDMTKSQLVKGAFRMLTLKLGQAKIPMIVTNHTYDVIGCALKGTKIKTPDGNIDISEIKVGDYVNTMVGSKKVIDTYEYEFDEYYQIELENGSVYNLTGEHKLMTQEGEWKKVSELTEEDILINIGN
jgi:RecA/RadA recombinase